MLRKTCLWNLLSLAPSRLSEFPYKPVYRNICTAYAIFRTLMHAYIKYENQENWEPGNKENSD